MIAYWAEPHGGAKGRMGIPKGKETVGFVPLGSSRPAGSPSTTMRHPRLVPQPAPDDRLPALRLFRHASIRTLIAALCRGALWCSQFQGRCYLCSDLGGADRSTPADQPRPRSRPNSALGSASRFPSREQTLYPSFMLLPAGWLSPSPFPWPCGRKADRTLPRSPTGDAAALPVCAPPPLPPASSPFSLRA